MKFERRLQWFTILLSVAALVLIVRLVDIQVLRADQFEDLAERMMTRPVRYLRPPRGTIRDRQGRPLVADEPASDISVHYAILTGNSNPYVRAIARKLQERGAAPAAANRDELVAQLYHEIARIWQTLSELTGTPVSELLERGQTIRARVERIREDAYRRTRIRQSVREENELHPLVEGVDNELALAVRVELERFAWLQYPLLRVVPSSRRVAYDADALAHVLGRLGEASRERIDEDPLRGDELRELRAGDACGVSGVEWLAEGVLRGRRGRVVEDLDRQEIERTEPVPGRDVYLTIDLELQRRVLELLASAVDESQHAAGGAAVVLDVATREVLALVSYPTYRYDAFDADYEELSRDTRRRPLLFRAVAGTYPPGSTCKAITLAGGLSDGVIGPEERIHCTGHLLPDQPTMFRCWIYKQRSSTHDYLEPAGQNAEFAVRNSCNIYFFHVGERLGADRLCHWFGQFGLGQTAGTGLLEESQGIVPTAEWLWDHQQRKPQTSDAWNFAIGQGEVTITPIQAANVAANIAAGRWEPVVLARDEHGLRVGSPPPTPVEFSTKALTTLRAGMWRVVNETGGTARAARLGISGYEFCGKTGSAQAPPRVVTRRYICEWPDGRREEVVATSQDEALEQFPGAKPEIVGWRAEERFPDLEDDRLPAHAWFIGFTQPKDTPRGAVPARSAYAIAVLIEFGESGGQVAAPVARQIAELMLSE